MLRQESLNLPTQQLFVLSVNRSIWPTYIVKRVSQSGIIRRYRTRICEANLKIS
nr:MAG TPA: hypothetical protein [Caudoviricetes sp.]